MSPKMLSEFILTCDPSNVQECLLAEYDETNKGGTQDLKIFWKGVLIQRKSLFRIMFFMRKSFSDFQLAEIHTKEKMTYLTYGQKWFTLHLSRLLTLYYLLQLTLRYFFLNLNTQNLIITLSDLLFFNNIFSKKKYFHL